METLSLETCDHRAVVKFNRPQALNALSTKMAEELSDVFQTLESDRSVWVAILAAAGEKAFCAGADLKERKDMSKDEMKVQRALFVRAFKAVTFFPKPVIAAVNGFALGGGFEFALGCDIILAAQSALFGLPEVGLGIIPGGGGTQNLPRRIGPQRAKELIFTGRRLTALQAAEWGIVSRVVPDHELMQSALDLAAEMCRNAPVALWQAKKAINTGLEVGLNEGFAFEAEAYNVCLATEDRDEGLRAFNEKRPPRYQGR